MIFKCELAKSSTLQEHITDLQNLGSESNTLGCLCHTHFYRVWSTLMEAGRVQWLFTTGPCSYRQDGARHQLWEWIQPSLKTRPKTLADKPFSRYHTSVRGLEWK